MSQIDWKNFENALFTASLEAATHVIERSKATFYAVAFHEFYAETDGPIAMPCLAANTVEDVDSHNYSRWSSADWKWTQLKYVAPELRKLHRTIEKVAGSDGEELWQQTYARFVDAFVHVAKRLSAQLRLGSQVTKDFGVFVFTEEDEVEVLQRCVTPSKFKKLFPQLQNDMDAASRHAASSPQSKMEAYRKDLRRFEKEIVKLGGKATPMLCEVLENDREQAWAAADLLAKIGLPEPLVIRILKKRAKSGHELAFHETTALALLGEVEFLLELAQVSKSQDVAIDGISNLYSVWVDWCQERRALDYQPIERLLAIPSCKGKVKELFSGPCEITISDVDEALRGLESKHSVVREHAVTVLGSRRLGAKAAARILPAIAARLQDRSATVRRLAILSLSLWKKSAKSYTPAVRKLFRDRDECVAEFAKAFVRGAL